MIKFNEFQSSNTISTTDQIVGYANTSFGGERRWTVGTMLSGTVTDSQNIAGATGTGSIVPSVTKSGSNLQFKKIKAYDSTISIVDTPTDIVFSVPSNPNTVTDSQNIAGATGTGSIVPSVTKSGSNLQFKKIKQDGGITVTETPTDVIISTPVTSINNQTSSQYTVQLTDKDNIICTNSSTPNTVTLPTSIVTPGFQAIVLQIGTGQTTISPAPGVVLRAPVGSALFGQYSAATIIYIDSTTQWIVYGDVVPQ